MCSRLLVHSSGESSLQVECISTPVCNPGRRRHGDVPNSCPIRQEVKHWWSSWYGHLLLLLPPVSGFLMAFLGSPRLPFVLPGGVPSSILAFLGESQLLHKLPGGVPRTFIGSPQEGSPAGQSDPRITYNVLPTLAPQASLYLLDPRPWAL